MKNILTSLLIISIVFTSCKKDNTTDLRPANNYTSWTTTINNDDNGYYSQKAPNGNEFSGGIWGSMGSFGLNTLSSDAFKFDANNDPVEAQQIAIEFQSKPTVSQTYQLAPQNALSPSTCFFWFSGNPNVDYTAVYGQSVSVNVSGAIVSVSFSNITVEGQEIFGSTTYTGKISGILHEGK